MKKTLLSLGLAVLAFGASAQLSPSGEGYSLNMTDGTSQCHFNSAPTHGSIMNTDGNTLLNAGSPYTNFTTEGQVLNSVSSIPAGGTVTWFAFPSIISDNCSNLYAASTGIDLSNESEIQITVQSTVAGATLDIFLGGEGQWTPASSTYNTGGAPGEESIIATVTCTEADKEYTFTLDLNEIATDVWTAWTGKNKIQSYGFRSGTADADFLVTQLNVGDEVEDVTSLSNNAEAVNFTAYPNPATSTVNFTSDVEGTVELANALGTVVTTAEGTSMDVSELPAGIYFATLKVNGESKAVQRVQVQ